VPNCNRDLGWQVRPSFLSLSQNLASRPQTPIDVPVFLLHEWAPSWLAFVQNANNFFFPLNALVSSPTLQSWLHRWDAVDLSTDPVAYSQVRLSLSFLRALSLPR
jgi:hypothetical protein